MAAGPLLRWRRDRLKRLGRRMAVPVLLAVLALIALLIFAPGMHILPLLGLALSFGAGAGSLAPLWKRNLRRTPLFIWGMVIAHLGIAVSLAGMACESAFTRETLVAARPGETVAVGPYDVKFAGRRARSPGPIGPRSRRRSAPAGAAARRSLLTPQSRMFSAPPTETSETAIATRLDGQLYTVIGKPGDDGRWQLRLWWKPFVTLIWLGGAMIAFGGFLSLIGRVLSRMARGAARGGGVRMRRTILWLPLGLFLLFVAMVIAGLFHGNDTTIRSQMIGKPMPRIRAVSRSCRAMPAWRWRT